ncbi:MAG TPA: MmcQ/YjbR family DNA-binding protein [Chryseolinea sp.]|nr:MmcQ/YjbR family DNA-binding protein [Chryseolinea sp.]
MDLESFRIHCQKKKGVTEEFPFGENTLVFKVMGKMFALTDVMEFESINLKVDPEKGVELRERYPAVSEAYHMNKKHWITVETRSMVSDGLLNQWIDESYNLVVEGLTKSQKSALLSL